MTSHLMQRYTTDFSHTDGSHSKMMFNDFPIPLHFGGGNSTSPANQTSYDSEKALPKGIHNNRLCPPALFTPARKLEQFVSPLTEVNLTFHTKQNPPARESKATFLIYFVDQQKQLTALEAKLRREVERETQHLHLLDSESRCLDGELIPAWEQVEYHQPSQRRERRRQSLADMFAAFDFRDRGVAEMVYAADDYYDEEEEEDDNHHGMEEGIPDHDGVIRRSKSTHKIKRFLSRTASKVVKSFKDVGSSKTQDEIDRRRTSHITAPLSPQRESGTTLNSTSPRNIEPLTYTVPLSSGSSKAVKPKNRDSGISIFTSMTSKSRTPTKRGSQGSLSPSHKQYISSNPPSPRDSLKTNKNANNSSSTTLPFARKATIIPPHSAPAAIRDTSRPDSQRSGRKNGNGSRESFQAYRYPRMVHVDAPLNTTQTQQAYYGENDVGKEELEFGADIDEWDSRRRSLPVPPFPIGQVGLKV